MKAITTHLPDALIHWIKEFSKEYGKSQREIIETAVRSFREEEKRKKLKITFQKASQDKEILDMAEENISDYQKSLSSLL